MLIRVREIVTVRAKGVGLRIELRARALNAPTASIRGPIHTLGIWAGAVGALTLSLICDIAV